MMILQYSSIKELHQKTLAEINVVETIKNGDVVKLQANDDTSILTNQNTQED